MTQQLKTLFSQIVPQSITKAVQQKDWYDGAPQQYSCVIKVLEVHHVK